MALMKLFQVKNNRRMAEVIKITSNFLRLSSNSTNKDLEDISQSRKEDDMPVEIEDPFATEKPKCILCKYDIEPDFRNVRLLSQFMSSYTGRIYGRHITGLCKHKQHQVNSAIKKAQRCGLLGVTVKNPNFLGDPDLYDSTKPFKVL